MPLGAVCLWACQSPSGGEDPTQWRSIPSGIGPVKQAIFLHSRGLTCRFLLISPRLELAFFGDPTNMFFPSQVFIDQDAKVWLRVDLLENVTIQLLEMWCSARDTEDVSLTFLGIKPHSLVLCPCLQALRVLLQNVVVCLCKYLPTDNRRQSSANCLTWDVTDSSNDTKQ